MSPLTADDLAEAELRFRVSLPGDYREFLRYVDAGGPGPDTLCRLQRGPGGWAWEGDEQTICTWTG